MQKNMDMKWTLGAYRSSKSGMWNVAAQLLSNAILKSFELLSAVIIQGV